MEFSLEDLPEVLADRVRAATGQPRFLGVHRAGEWVVEALTGDRATVMRLDVRDDGSVSETTDSFDVDAIESIDATTDAVVTAGRAAHRITLPVSQAFAAALANAKRRSTSQGRDVRSSRPRPRS